LIGSFFSYLLPPVFRLPIFISLSCCSISALTLRLFFLPFSSPLFFHIPSILSSSSLSLPLLPPLFPRCAPFSSIPHFLPSPYIIVFDPLRSPLSSLTGSPPFPTPPNCTSLLTCSLARPSYDLFLLPLLSFPPSSLSVRLSLFPFSLCPSFYPLPPPANSLLYPPFLRSSPVSFSFFFFSYLLFSHPPSKPPDELPAWCGSCSTPFTVYRTPPLPTSPG